MGYSQGYISKIYNAETKYIPTLEHITEEQRIRKYVVDRILECKVITTNERMFNDNDIAYIKLLDFCLVDRDKIRATYYNISQYRISKAFRDKKITFAAFDPYSIGLTQDEYNLFLDSIK